jgi:hypothetical protein
MFVLAVGIVAVGASADGTRGPLPLGREASQSSLARESSVDTVRGYRFASRRAPAPPAPPSNDSTTVAAAPGAPE